MNARNYFDHNAHIGKPGPFDHSEIRGDVVDWPAVLVTEEEANPDTLRRYHSAEERLALELIAEEAA